MEIVATLFTGFFISLVFIVFLIIIGVGFYFFYTKRNEFGKADFTVFLLSKLIEILLPVLILLTALIYALLYW